MRLGLSAVLLHHVEYNACDRRKSVALRRPRRCGVIPVLPSRSLGENHFIKDAGDPVRAKAARVSRPAG